MHTLAFCILGGADPHDNRPAVKRQLERGTAMRRAVGLAVWLAAIAILGMLASREGSGVAQAHVGTFHGQCPGTEFVTNGDFEVFPDSFAGWDTLPAGSWAPDGDTKLPRFFPPPVPGASSAKLTPLPTVVPTPGGGETPEPGIELPSNSLTQVLPLGNPKAQCFIFHALACANPSVATTFQVRVFYTGGPSTRHRYVHPGDCTYHSVALTLMPPGPPPVVEFTDTLVDSTRPIKSIQFQVIDPLNLVLNQHIDNVSISEEGVCPNQQEQCIVGGTAGLLDGSQAPSSPGDGSGPWVPYVAIAGGAAAALALAAGGWYARRRWLR